MSVTLAPDAPATHTPEEIDARIQFLDEDEILEIDLSDLTLENSADVNLLYDRLEARIAETLEPLWFFLINYRGTRIDPGAWFAHSRRGKDLNLAHSMASVRYDASEDTRRQIERSAGTDNFDPNLFADRDMAIAALRDMPSKRQAKIVHVPNYTEDEFRSRIRFLEEDQIMDVDFSNVTFEHSRDVNDCYDVLDALIAESGKKWYFLVNYENTKIFSGAWVQYAARGKALNEAGSLGSVRYAPGSETETDIRLRAESGGFRPNIRNTREEALERIAEMKRGED
ncbi:MAG: hypothetical protein HKN18_06840 [Silicimonas sp.]|nr:hypothetical protein [Silicimonas sp.]